MLNTCNGNRRFPLILLFVLCFFCTAQAQQDSLKNLPEYSLPLINGKLVIAHCMTNIIRYQGHEYEDSCNPAYYPEKGNITESIGGLTQVKPMDNELRSKMTLDEAVEFEMRAAKRSGIDAFQFYYPLGTFDWDNIIEAYFRVAAQKHIDFKFTFCISHPNGGKEADKVAQFAKRINGIMDVVGHDNPHWLRTPDGRLVVYQWMGEGLADIPADGKGLSQEYYIARAYKKIADAVHERFACVVTINTQVTKQQVDDILDYFPAVWIWTWPYYKDYMGYMVAGECAKRQRTFTGSVFCDFYTSKLLKSGTWDMYRTAQEAVDAGMGKIERKQVITGLSYNFRKLFEFGIAHNAPIMNVITWNDYPEGHHLAPEINHNEGFSILLNYYKSIWNKQSSPYAGRDVAVVFFKKYQHNIKPYPFDIPIKSFQQEFIPARWEDSIEVVTLLKAPGILTVNGKSVPVGSGLVSTKFRSQSGPVKVAVSRKGQTTVRFITPEGITGHPYRTDRVTYTYSSEFDRFYKDIYPGFKPDYSHEYNEGFVEKAN